MIVGDKRAESKCLKALLDDAAVTGLYGKSGIFHGYAAPNSLATLDSYVLIHRIDSVTLDAGVIDGTITDKLRRVRLQVDVADVSYQRMVERSEIIKDALERKFPSCIDSDTNGVAVIGQKVWNVCSVDIIIIESEEE